MRRNPLLYSDHGEIEEPLIKEEPKQERSWAFYFIILANSLLVLFVLGIIWFLFLKSPDLHIKELSDSLFNSKPSQTLTPKADNGSTPQKDEEIVETAPTIRPDQQEEIRQARLKQMRAQEKLDAERQRLEKIRAELEAEKLKTDAAKKALTQEVKRDSAKDITSMQAAQQKTIQQTSLKPTETQGNDSSENTPEVQTALEETTPNKEAAIVPNAASEAPQPSSNTVGTQVDQIMEAIRQQQKEKEDAVKPQTDSRSSLPQDATTKATRTVSHTAIERQLEVLIETEELKSSAKELLKQAEELDKEIRINQNWSILQAKAV